MDERKHIQVIVAGGPGVGKTTVATIIQRALEEAGFERVGLVDDTSPIDHETLHRRKRAIQENQSTIHIHTRSLRFPEAP